MVRIMRMAAFLFSAIGVQIASGIGAAALALSFLLGFLRAPFVWLLPRYGHWTQSAILHDYLWSLARSGQFNFYDADGLFNRSMRELSESAWV